MQAILFSESCLHIFVKIKLQRQTNMRWNPLGVSAEKTFEFIFNNMKFLLQEKYENTPNLKDHRHLRCCRSFTIQQHMMTGRVYIPVMMLTTTTNQ